MNRKPLFAYTSEHHAGTENVRYDARNINNHDSSEGSTDCQHIQPRTKSHCRYCPSHCATAKTHMIRSKSQRSKSLERHSLSVRSASEAMPRETACRTKMDTFDIEPSSAGIIHVPQWSSAKWPTSTTIGGHSNPLIDKNHCEYDSRNVTVGLKSLYLVSTSSETTV